jgi:hypothetical protein
VESYDESKQSGDNDDHGGNSDNSDNKGTVQPKDGEGGTY